MTLFCKNLNQRSLTPRWPLTPHLLRSHVWLYPRIIVSKSHENTSMYVDTVIFFVKNLNQRSLTPKWPLTPHLLRSHVWLYPRIIVFKSHGKTSMYVDTVVNFANYHIHTTYMYILHVRTFYVQNQWSRSLSQARQKTFKTKKWIISQMKVYIWNTSKKMLFQKYWSTPTQEFVPLKIWNF